jgi:hypothetical protein
MELDLVIKLEDLGVRLNLTIADRRSIACWSVRVPSKSTVVTWGFEERVVCSLLFFFWDKFETI